MSKSDIGCCGFFGIFGRVLRVVLPNVSPVSVAGNFRGQESELCALVQFLWIVEYLKLWDQLLSLSVDG